MAALKKPRITKFHRLKRFKFRSDMKKENLYNLSRLKPPLTQDRTYFQQKWTAKSITRAYHAEHVREGQWVRMFSRRPNAVVPMSPNYLARHDGADEAAGRGSGKETLPQWLEREKVDSAIAAAEPKAKEDALKSGKKWEGIDGERGKWRREYASEVTQRLRSEFGSARRVDPIPYMQMVYHPFERRLDMAVYRALFASSAKQARQIVCHGGVKVNGQTIRFSGYMLNPGDMFQVDPERAMWAVGENSGNMDRMKAIMNADMKAPKNPARPSGNASSSPSSHFPRSSPSASPPPQDPVSETSAEDQETDRILAEENEEVEEESEEDAIKANKKLLRNLLKDTRELHDRGKAKKTINSKMKQALRDFARELRTAQSKIKSQTSESMNELRSRFEELSSSLNKQSEPERPKAREQPREEDRTAQGKELSQQQGSTGPRWHPRMWMSPFAFIPRYLEVNHAICSAVYLRHPVCGPGFAEVPTPYGIETGALAFNWYLRRR